MNGEEAKNGDVSDHVEVSDNKGDSDHSVMEIEDDDDDENSKQTSASNVSKATEKSAKDDKEKKTQDGDEKSQDSVQSEADRKESDDKANEADSDCEMISDVSAKDNKTADTEKEQKDAENKDKGSEEKKKESEKGHTLVEVEVDLDPPPEAKTAEGQKAGPEKPSKFSVMEQGPDNLDMRPMARLLHDIGLDLARESVYGHLIKVQNKKQSQNKLKDNEIQQLNKLKVSGGTSGTGSQVDVILNKEAFSH